MKKLLFTITLLFFLCFLFTSATFVEAGERRLEIKYPEIPNVPIPTIEGGVPNYVKYIFNFAIWASGFIALVVLIYAGLKYLTSAGSPEGIKDAKDQISAALLGLLILFGSYLILITINPQLVIFNFGEIEPILPALESGVLLCKEPVAEIYSFDTIRESAKSKTPEEQKAIQQQLEEILRKVKEKCWYASSSGPIAPEFDNKAKLVYLIPAGTTKYGAILYDESNFMGSSDVLFVLDPEIAGYDIIIKPSSVRRFVIKDEPSPDWYVNLYELIDYNEADPAARQKSYTLQGDLSECYDGLKTDFPEQTPSFGGNYYFQSAKIEGNLFVVFFREGDCNAPWTAKTEVYALISSDHNLNDNRPMNQWCQPGTISAIPCAESMVIVSADMF